MTFDVDSLLNDIEKIISQDPVIQKHRLEGKTMQWFEEFVRK